MKKLSFRGAALGLGLVLWLAGCESTGEPAAPKPPAGPRATATEAAAGAPKASGAANRKAAVVTTSRAFPTGNPKSSAIQVDKLAPAQVMVGEVFGMTLRVTNLTDQALGNVVLTERLGDNLEIAESSVKLENTVAGRVWKLGDLGPNEVVVIDLTASARKPERIATCLSVAYDTTLCSTIPVVQPALRLVASGTAAALACEDIVYRYTLTNAGTGAAEDVVLRVELPEGLTDAGGRRSITRNVGSLASGKSIELSLEALATRPGRFEHSASATGSNGLAAKSQPVATAVTRPLLEITEVGPKSAFIGRNLSYDVTVKNTGDGTARDTLIVHEIPAGLSFASATQGGRQVGGNVQWNLGDVAPGGSATVNLKLKADSLGNFVARTSTRAYCAEEASATATTSVTGIPGVQLEVVDLEDPVEVGQVLTYLITVTNTGTAQVTNLKVTASMPEGTEFVSADGSTQPMAGAGANGAIALTPLGVLAPKAKATWQVRLRATRASDARFAVSLTSDQLSSPVTESEATNYYE
jgi:uncharacterized repeat protein (TIGR01451 family)